MTSRVWHRDELIVAFSLYQKIPFTKIHFTNPLVADLSHLLGRSPSAVALKLVNFARFDPMLLERTITGMKHGSRAEKDIWEEFDGNWEELSYRSELIVAKLNGTTLEKLVDVAETELPEGKTRHQIIKARVNQDFFRQVVLGSYNSQCCVTGIAIAELLVAAHIVPWSKDEKNRTNPSNGLCLNTLHEKAFDRGFMTVTPDHKVKFSKDVMKLRKNPGIRSFFLIYDGSTIRPPNRFMPDPKFLEYHNHEVFDRAEGHVEMDFGG